MEYCSYGFIFKQDSCGKDNRVKVYKKDKYTNKIREVEKGNSVKFECDFDFDKYKQEWARLKLKSKEGWTPDIIQSVSTVLAAQTYPWGLILRNYKVYYDSNTEKHKIVFTLEV